MFLGFDCGPIKPEEEDPGIFVEHNQTIKCFTNFGKQLPTIHQKKYNSATGIYRFNFFDEMKDEKPYKNSLLILLLEDNQVDADLLAEALHREGYQISIHHVSNEESFLEKLQTCTYDLILSDYNLPGYTGMAALKKVKLICPQTPFICVSGNIGEDLAVELLKEGAADYVSKEKLEKLPLAINRALGEIQKQRDLQKAESELRNLSRAVQQSPSSIIITDISGAIIYTNPKFSEVSGYALDQVMGKLLRILKKGNTYDEVYTEIWATITAGNTWNGEYLSKRSNGELFWEHTTISPILSAEDKITNFLAISEDITEKKTTEQAMLESEKTFRILFQDNPLCMWVYDVETLHFLSVNQMAVIKYGYSEEEFYAMTIMDIRPEEELPRLTKNLNQENDPIQHSSGWRHKLKTGEIIDVEIISHSILFHEKRARLVVVMDVTERVSAEREIKKLSQAVQQSPVSIIITNVDGNIEYVNNRTEEMTGYSKAELIGKNPRIFSSGEKSREEYAELWNTIKKAERWSGEFHNRKKSGELYWESATISPILNKEGEITQFLDIKEDITERKQLIQDLIISKEKAEASDKLKTAFMHNISHEVRTPLNGILGFATLISEPDLDEGTKERYLNILNTSSYRLLNTITSYMDISLLASGTQETHIKLTKIENTLNDIYELFLPRCKAKGLDLKFEVPVEVLMTELDTDRTLIEKALQHLLDNALKFTERGTIILGGYTDDTSLNISVTDTGIGVEKESKKSIFSYFMQEDPLSTSGYEGSGLGLSIAKGFINLLGGDIRVESEKGRGSKFTISLPRTINPKGCESVVTARSESICKPGPSRKILVVEDDDLNYSYIDIVVELEGLVVLRAKNGQEAIDVYKQQPELALILMDIKMPIMDGLEATRHIRAINPKVPIVAITAFAQSGDRAKSIDAGCNDYLSKPVGKKDLLAVIHKYLAVE